MNATTTKSSGQAVLHVRVGEDVHASLARAREAMETLQQGRRPKPHFAVGFAEVGQMLAVLAGVNYPDRLTTTILAGWGRA